MAMNIPSTLTAGDLWEWTDSQADYPAPTWVLSYHFSGPKAFSAIGVASGSDHDFSVAATDTKDQPHGTYEWLARAVNGSTSTTLERGRITIQPNFANLAADNRSHNRKVYEALQAVIENRATTDQLSYSIAGRSVSRMTWDEILAAYDRYRLAVAKEMGLHPGRVFIRTGNA
jgi:hypothetical protein